MYSASGDPMPTSQDSGTIQKDKMLKICHIAGLQNFIMPSSIIGCSVPPITRQRHQLHYKICTQYQNQTLIKTKHQMIYSIHQGHWEYVDDLHFYSINHYLFTTFTHCISGPDNTQDETNQSQLDLGYRKS